MPILRLLTSWKSSLKWKLIIIFSGIVLFNLSVIGFIVHQQVSLAIKEDVMKSSNLVLKQANLYLIEYLGEIEKFMLTLGMSQEMDSWSTLTGERRTESIVPYSIMQKNYLQPFTRAHSDLLSISIYNTRGNEMHYSPNFGLAFNYSLSNEPWFNDVEPAGKTTYIITENSNYVNHMLHPTTFQVITMVKKFGFNGALYVKVDLFPTKLQAILNEINLSNEVTGFIINIDGTIIAHPKEELFLSKLDPSIMKHINKSSSGAFVEEMARQIIVYEKIADTDWMSVIAVPYSEVTRNVDTIRHVVIVTAVSCLLISALLIVMISSSIINRLNKIRRSMKQTGQGNMNMTIPVEGQDEISLLARSYNYMLDDLQLHVQRLSESKIAEKHAVLFSLQAQIDSHFLYNTLEIINSMATQIKHHDIEQITVALARMFRYTASNRDNCVTVEKEVQHALYYLQIIKIRYGDHFSYDIQVEDSCLEVQCIKVILQPIVENAVKHGYETIGRPFHISIGIRSELGKVVFVRIADNGRGFREEQLEELNHRMQNDEPLHEEYQRIGLLNILYRLRIHYDSPFTSLQVRNLHSGGAEVEIRFPL